MNSNTTPTPKTDRAIAANYKDIWDRYASFRVLCEKLERELAKKTNEVARLRKLLNRAIAIFEHRDCTSSVSELITELEALAPAPEEPVIQDSRITEPEWRVLGEDEVIQEGDECYTTGPIPRWKPVPDKIIGWEWSIGDISVRTRRPLPTTNCKQISSKLVDGQKQGEMPLEKEIVRLKEMVMDAAKRGDMMAAHWKERAEKAEALIKQLHHYAGIIEGFQNTDK
jgi:hypothetical protein